MVKAGSMGWDAGLALLCARKDFNPGLISWANSLTCNAATFAGAVFWIEAEMAITLGIHRSWTCYSGYFTGENVGLSGHGGSGDSAGGCCCCLHHHLHCLCGLCPPKLFFFKQQHNVCELALAARAMLLGCSCCCGMDSMKGGWQLCWHLARGAPCWVSTQGCCPSCPPGLCYCCRAPKKLSTVFEDYSLGIGSYI